MSLRLYSNTVASPLNPTRDTWMALNNGVPSTDDKGIVGSMSFGFVSKGTTIQRALMGFDLSGISGTVVSASLTVNYSGGTLAAVPAHIYRVLRTDWVEGDGSADSGAWWTNYKPATAWTSAGCSGDGTDYTSTNGVAFDVPTSLGTQAYDVAALVQDALDAGDTSVSFLFRRDTESGTVAFPTIDSREGTMPPVLQITYTPAPYDGVLLEGEPGVGRVSDTTWQPDIPLGSGAAGFTAANLCRVKYSSTDPTLATGTTTTGVAMNGHASGYVLLLDSITGLTPNTLYYWRVEFSSDTGATWPIVGNPDTFRTLATPGSANTPVTLCITSDGHRKGAKNAGTQEGLDAITVQDKTYQNIRAETAADGGPIHAWIDNGDSIYTKAGLTADAFPVETDGSADPIAVPTSPYATNLTDCEECCRYLRKDSDMPFNKTVCIFNRGNHDCDQSYHDNVARSDSSRSNTLAAMASHLGHKTGLPTSPSTGNTRWTAAEAQADGHYWVEKFGSVVVCGMDINGHSALSVTDPDASPPPTAWDTVSDITLGTNQFDFFLHLTTGVLATTTAAHAILMLHHKSGRKGGQPTGTPYGRGDATYVKQATVSDGEVYDQADADRSEWMNDVHPRLAALKAATGLNIAVVVGHDHCGQMVHVDGILYITVPAPGQFGASGGPYANGFTGALNGRYDTSVGGMGFSPNSGYLKVDADAQSITFKIKRTYVAGLASAPADPSDSITTNDQVVQSLRLVSSSKRIFADKCPMLNSGAQRIAF